MPSCLYSYCDLYIPFSEAADLLGLSRAELTNAVSRRLIVFDCNRDDIYGPVTHMSSVFSFIFRSSFLIEKGDLMDIDELIDSMEELGRSHLAGLDDADSFVSCICKALNLGPMVFSCVLREFWCEIDQETAARLHSSILTKIRKLFKNLNHESIEDHRMNFSLMISERDRLGSISVRKDA